jgi:hypothetical protein
MKNKNQLSQKSKLTVLTTEEVAEIAECSTSLVKQVVSGDRQANNGKGAKVALIVDLAETGKNALVEEIKRIVKFY